MVYRHINHWDVGSIRKEFVNHSPAARDLHYRLLPIKTLYYYKQKKSVTSGVLDNIS